MIKSKCYNLYADICFNNNYYIISILWNLKKNIISSSNDINNVDLGYYEKNSLINSRKIESNSQEFHEMHNDKKLLKSMVIKIKHPYLKI